MKKLNPLVTDQVLRAIAASHVLAVLIFSTASAFGASQMISAYPQDTAPNRTGDFIFNRNTGGSSYATRRSSMLDVAAAVREIVEIKPGVQATAEDVILDTDLGDELDDVGDLAVLHALADQGEVNILAVMAANVSSFEPAAIEVINRFYGRPNLPIGAAKSGSASGFDITGTYLKNNFPHGIDTSANTQSAVTLYRRILAGRPDASVTLIFVGQARNLYDLWNSAGDSLSPLSGSALVQRKAKKIVAVMGTYPGTGSEYNFTSDPTAGAIFNSITSVVPVTFVGIEIAGVNQCAPLITFGNTILTARSTGDPVRDAFAYAYSTWQPCGSPIANRAAWGSVGILFAARGYVYRGTTLFSATKGFNTVNATTGANTWANNAGANQEYLTAVASNASLQAMIEALLNARPAVHGGNPAKINVQAGSQAVPAITLGNSTDGIWRKGDDNGVDFSINGAHSVRIFKGGGGISGKHLYGSGVTNGWYFVTDGKDFGDVGAQLVGGFIDGGVGQPGIKIVSDPFGTIGNVTANRLYFQSQGNFIAHGTGTPEGSLTAPVGSLYLRDNGGAGTTLYIKESGTSNTGWVPMVSGSVTLPPRVVSFVFNTPTTGQKFRVYIKKGFTIGQAVISSDVAGSCVLDVWRDTYANGWPTVADTITASAKPTLSSADQNKDSTLTGWTKTIPDDSWLAVNVDSASTVGQVTLTISE
jgi:purine nucleosidase